MYEKESAVEGETVGGGAYPFVDEPFQGYSHLLDEETGEFPRSTASGLCVYYTGTVRPIGIGSKSPAGADHAAAQVPASAAFAFKKLGNDHPKPARCYP